MEKLSNTVDELKKALLIKKVCILTPIVKVIKGSERFDQLLF